ncbi:MAG: PIG-L family deacetylase, partial [Bacteroidota bacterium]
ADLHDAIKKLNVLGSVLYVAAHPDDENTRMISWLSNHLRMHTGYLSLTRGDGGQNRIGPEIRELLGVIRTQELLLARGVDGGVQLFSRANDFGYSKNAEETLKIWNESEVLSDVVWAIRKFQPDVIVNRFDHTTSGRTHGHHTSSAILSHQAFDLTADPTVFPEQLEHIEPWQPRRLFFNTSWWFYGSRENFAKADKSKLMSVDAGTYYPLLGKSNNEIAAESRSMHKCQGMGSTSSRGSLQEYLKILKGDLPSDKENLFEGINTTWTRVEGGAPIGQILAAVEADFQYDNPAASVPKLLQAYELIQALPEGKWKRLKTAEIKWVIKGCLGLFLEATANDYSATPGQEIELRLEAISRLGKGVQLQSLQFLPMGIDTTLDLSMETNQVYKWNRPLRLPKDLAYSNPYWLNQPAELGMYQVDEQLMRGLPETPRTLQVQFTVQIGTSVLSYVEDLVFKKTDPVKGEIYRPFELIPPVFANIAEQVYVFANEAPKSVQVLLKTGKANVAGTVKLQHPENWRVEPASIDFNLSLKGEEQLLDFKIYPPSTQHVGGLSVEMTVDGQQYDQEMILIEYDHIPTQTVFRQSSAKIVKIDLKKEGQRVGYIMGAGDEIPASLEQIGYEVTILKDRDIRLDYLKKFDAIILGIRAYNTNERLKFHQSKLMQYVEEGGTMIVQYNTNRGLATKDLGPYPFKVSRDRVTVEEAPVRFLKADHHVLNYPNKITASDFDSWVQERGLYFPNEWDERYEAILSCNDPNEPARDGGLLVTTYGKGNYIYTGYSWFRELPAGVPGAFRLFTNLISIGKKP